MHRVNKSIGKKVPYEYFREAVEQCETKKITCDSITNITQLKENLAANCIPFEVTQMGHENYQVFLDQRRRLMAQKIKNYYNQL